MALKNMNAGASGSFEQPETGMQAAVLTRIIDLGTSEMPGGQYAAKRQVQLTFELEQRLTTGDYAGQRMFSNAYFTASINEKANLRRFLDGWRGRPFTEEEAASFDLSKILGQPCMLNLAENRTGRVVPVSASRMPRGIAPLVPEGELLFFDMDDPDRETFEKLHEKMQIRLLSTPEGAAMWQDNAAGQGANPHPGTHQQGGPEVGGAQVGLQPPSNPKAANGGGFDDDIPFSSYLRGHEYAI